jgi:hypothetical protein
MTQTSLNLVTRELDSEKYYMDASNFFGHRFNYEVKPMIIKLAEKLSDDYKGCSWRLKIVSNDSMYLTPSNLQLYHVICFDIYEECLSADGFGLVSTIFTVSHLSYIGSTAFIDTYADMFYKLMQVALDHPESEELLQATDTLSV